MLRHVWSLSPTFVYILSQKHPTALGEWLCQTQKEGKFSCRTFFWWKAQQIWQWLWLGSLISSEGPYYQVSSNWFMWVLMKTDFTKHLISLVRSFGWHSKLYQIVHENTNTDQNNTWFGFIVFSLLWAWCFCKMTKNLYFLRQPHKDKRYTTSKVEKGPTQKENS